jgi:hypothetical protein
MVPRRPKARAALACGLLHLLLHLLLLSQTINQLPTVAAAPATRRDQHTDQPLTENSLEAAFDSFWGAVEGASDVRAALLALPASLLTESGVDPAGWSSSGSSGSSSGRGGSSNSTAIPPAEAAVRALLERLLFAADLLPPATAAAPQQKAGGDQPKSQQQQQAVESSSSPTSSGRRRLQQDNQREQPRQQRREEGQAEGSQSSSRAADPHAAAADGLEPELLELARSVRESMAELIDLLLAADSSSDDDGDEAPAGGVLRGRRLHQGAPASSGGGGQTASAFNLVFSNFLDLLLQNGADRSRSFLTLSDVVWRSLLYAILVLLSACNPSISNHRLPAWQPS